MVDDADLTNDLIEQPEAVVVTSPARDGGMSLDMFWAILDPLEA